MPPIDSPCLRRALLATAVLAVSSMLVPEESRAATSFAVIGAPESLSVRVQRGAAVSALRIPVDARWTAPPGETIRSYRLQKRVDGGAWANVALADPTKPRAVVTLDSWRVYGFRVAATDSAGRLGAWSAESKIRARQAIQTEDQAGYSGAWPRKASLSFLEGATRLASEAGASVEFNVSQRGIAWVATQGPGRGRAAVHVDGTRVATVDLSATTVRYRRVVWTRAWPDPAERTVKIVVESPASNGVDLDGLVVVEPPAPDPVLVGAGDIARCGSTSTGDDQTATLLDGFDGTVFTAGDNAYPDGSIRDYEGCYAPSWGRHRERTRPVPGNHEYATPGAAGYKEYFGSAAVRNGATWYAYDLGAWRVYALDSECALIGGCGSTSPQGRWLATDLARHPRRCVVAIWHRPRFSSGLERGDVRMAWMWRTLDDAGAEVVVSGHDHDYERFARKHSDGTAAANGVRQFVVGTGGAVLRPFGSVVPNSVVRWNGSFGVLVLRLRPAGYSWRFAPVAGSSFNDSGSSPCL
jgi:hypothetical protein